MSMTLRHRRLIILGMLLLSWTIIIGSIVTMNVRNERMQTEMLLLDQYRLLGNVITTTWRWNSSHGGIFVPVNETAPLNTFLSEPDRFAVTAEGDTLTKVTPLWMGYGFGVTANASDFLHIHPASQNPINPDYLADEWESIAIDHLKAGEIEIYELAGNLADSPRFRYIRPLVVEESCLRCHDDKGYVEGSIAGGLSITANAEPYFEWYKSETKHLVSSALVVWIIGCIGILIIMNNIAKRLQKEMTLKKFEGVLEMAGSAAHELNQPLQVISGYAELISMIDVEDRQSLHSMLHAIRENVLRLSAITRKLNGITRYETIELTSKDRIIDLDRAASDIAPVAGSAAPKDTPADVP